MLTPPNNYDRTHLSTMSMCPFTSSALVLRKKMIPTLFHCDSFDIPNAHIDLLFFNCREVG